jgi:hypothetical protein
VNRSSRRARSRCGSSVIAAKSGAGCCQSRRATCAARYADSPCSATNASRRASAASGVRLSRFSLTLTIGTGKDADTAREPVGGRAGVRNLTHARRALGRGSRWNAKCDNVLRPHCHTGPRRRRLPRLRGAG